MAHRNIDFEMIELQSLRSEIQTRIMIQNWCVLLSGILLVLIGASMAMRPEMSMMLALSLGLGVGVFSLVWCHNGVRQCQIKNYLLLLADRHSSDGGWERWLPDDRMPGILGNRWFIATKGAMMGAQVSAVALAVHLGGQPQGHILLAMVLVIAGTAWLLLTNPKEGLRPPSA